MVRGVTKIIVWGGAREKRRMAEMCDSKEPGDPGEAEPPHTGVMVGRAGRVPGPPGESVLPPACSPHSGVRQASNSVEYVLSRSEEEMFGGQKVTRKYTGLLRSSSSVSGTQGGSEAGIWGRGSCEVPSNMGGWGKVCP